jgi:drug/metabolite transporter (DMT)-like permease
MKSFLLILGILLAAGLFFVAGYLVYLNRSADQWGWFLFVGLVVTGIVFSDEVKKL